MYHSRNQWSKYALITRNIGDLTIYGLILVQNAYLSKNIVLSTNYSWISRDSVALDDAVLVMLF